MHIPTAHRAIEEQSRPSTINSMLLNTILAPGFVSVYLFALKPDPVSYYAEKQASRHTAALDGANCQYRCFCRSYGYSLSY